MKKETLEEFLARGGEIQKVNVTVKQYKPRARVWAMTNAKAKSLNLKTITKTKGMK